MCVRRFSKVNKAADGTDTTSNETDEPDPTKVIVEGESTPVATTSVQESVVEDEPTIVIEAVPDEPVMEPESAEKTKKNETDMSEEIGSVFKAY